MLNYDYQYDLYGQPFFSLPLDDKNSLLLKISASSGLKTLAGFAVKLCRYGDPGDITYRVGFTPEGSELAQGSISAGQVLPVYERFQHIWFPAVEVTGRMVYIALSCASGQMPLDGYRVVGPNQSDDDVFDDLETIPYWWEERHSWGMMVPKHYRPEKYASCTFACRLAGGEEKSCVSLRLFEEGELPPREAEPFDFLDKVFAPLYSEWKPIKKKPVPEGWVQLTADWRVVDETGGKAGLAAKDLEEFLRRSFALELTGERRIRFCMDSCLNVEGSEGHTIQVAPDEIIITAKNESGLLQAVIYLEDRMQRYRCPALPGGLHKRDSRYEIRMASGVYPAPFNYFPLQTGELWTDEYLWRLVHEGYNAIWLIVNLEEITPEGSILREVADPNCELVLARLRRITERAARWSVNVYLDLKTGYYKLFDQGIYERYPELKTFRKWGDTPCTGQAVFQKYLTETLQNLFRSAPLLKGLMVIYDTEGFYSCFTKNHQENCPNCQGHSAQELAGAFFRTLSDAVRQVRQDAQIIAWTYYCDEPWNYEVLRNLPENVEVLSCFSQFVKFHRHGIKNQTDDYSCFVTGPGEYFQKIEGFCRERNVPVLAKTEVSQGQEFVSTSYIPVLTQHQRRWDALAQYHLSGFMGDYIHRSFQPSPCTALMKRNIFDTSVEGEAPLTASDKLRWVAEQFFGTEAAEDILQAWDVFSEALCDNFPYSPGVCRYPGPIQAGPSQPFYLDPNRPVKRCCARNNSVDLEWTKLYFFEKAGPGTENPDWNSALVRRCLVDFCRDMEQGIELVRRADSEENHEACAELLSISSAMCVMAQSMIHFIDFVELRDKLQENPSLDVWQKLQAVCQAEMENTEKALALCRQDSSLGFSCEGQGAVRGGYFNAFTVEEKRRELLGTLAEIEEKMRDYHDAV